MASVLLQWQVQLFGALQVRETSVAGSDPGRVIEQFQTYKTGALFAYLSYYPGTRHSREMLAGLLWPDAEPEAARNRLTQALVWLRPRLEPEGLTDRGQVLLTDRSSIGLNARAIVTDVGRFDAALQEERLAPPGIEGAEKRAEALQKAVTLYRSELLTGYYEDWVLAERRRLQEEYLSALSRLSEYYEQLGNGERSLNYARQAVSADPYREETHCALIRLLARSGETAAALRQYHEMERVLAESLEEEPSAEARSLLEQIRKESSARPAPPPSAAASSAQTALPAPLTRFFGRTEEVRRIQQVVREGQVRLVTLIGPGGSGKTRLAVELARKLRSDFAGVVCFVPLADVADANLIPNAVAQALRLSSAVPSAPPAAAQEQVIERLSWQRSLLVLDNLEHLTEGGAAATLLHDFLERCPLLTLLVTSRHRLGIAGEQEITVPPLPVPVEPLSAADTQGEELLRFEAVQLFVDRAQAVRPSFHLTPRNANAVARICERLEGIPLAIELCAAWTQTLTPAQILEQLSHPLDLLVSRQPVPGVPARHHSLRDALEYSYQRLAPDLRRFFCFLSVFRNGWSLDAVNAVCLEGNGTSGSPLLRTVHQLTALRERSLIIAEEPTDDTLSEMRYRMLETLREFGAERLRMEWGQAEVDQLRQRHARYFLDLAEKTNQYPGGPEQEEALRLLETEHDNLRAVLAWALETGQTQLGLRLAGALAAFWDTHGYLGEGAQWLKQLLALPGALPTNSLSARSSEQEKRELLSIRARALTALGQLSRNQGSSAGLDAAMDEALRLWRQLGDERGIASCLQALATIAYSREGGVAAARAYLHEGLELARRLDDRSLIARALLNLGNIGLALGEWQQAESDYTESLTLYRMAGNPSRAGTLLNNLGLIARYQGNYAIALPFLEEAHRLGRELSNLAMMGVTAINQASVRRLQGEYEEAHRLLLEAAHWAAESGDRRLLPWCVREMGHLSCAQGDYATGVRLLGAAEAQRMAMGITFKPADPEELERTAHYARQALGEGGFAAAWAAGSASSRVQVYAEVLHLFEG